MTQVLVSIVMGSTSDWSVMQTTAELLEQFQLPYEVTVSSAHRAPQRTAALARQAAARGVKVIIAGAGGAAHLAGLLAAETILPVIGVPIDASPLQGLDALLATVQMPRGVPVATMAVGRAGAANAAILAAQILALSDARVAARMQEYKAGLAAKVEQDAAALQATIQRREDDTHAGR